MVDDDVVAQARRMQRDEIFADGYKGGVWWYLPPANGLLPCYEVTSGTGFVFAQGFFLRARTQEKRQMAATHVKLSHYG